MTKRLVLPALVALTLVASACGGDEEGTSSATSTQAAPAQTSEAAPSTTEAPPSTQEDEPSTGGTAAVSGEQVAADNGCMSCHVLPGGGSPGPGPDLTAIGSELSAEEITATLEDGPGSMPSYAELQSDSPEEFDALVGYLAGLQG